jgi:hypothetical protein
MRRRKLIAAVVALAVLVAVAVFVLWSSRDMAAGITIENADRLGHRFEDGRLQKMPRMTVADAEAILGAPPGDYRTGRSLEMDVEIIADGGLPDVIYWISDSCVVLITTDPTGCVDSIGRSETKKSPDSFGNLVWRAKRLWRRWFPE